MLTRKRPELNINRDQGPQLGDMQMVSELPVGDIKPNPWQPRKRFDEEKLKELAEEIKENGLLQPVVVFRGDDGSYYLIAGERRLRAHKLIEAKAIRAIIVKDYVPLKVRLQAITENTHREGLHHLEVVHAISLAIEAGEIDSYDDAFDMMKMSQPTRSKYSSMKNLSHDTQELAINAGYRDIDVLAKIGSLDELKQIDAIKHVVKNKLQRKDAVAYLNNVTGKSKKPVKAVTVKDTKTTMTVKVLKNLLSEEQVNDIREKIKEIERIVA